MEQVELQVESREALGSSAVRRLRTNGVIPGVVYAGGKDAQSLQIGRKDLVKVLTDYSQAQVFTFASGDKKLNGKRALIKILDIHPLDGNPIHVDFQEVHAGEAMSVSVPVRLTGEEKAAKTSGLILSHTSRNLEVSCIPSKIPADLTVDVSNLQVGGAIHAKDVNLPEGVQLVTEPSVVVVAGLGKSTAEEVTEQESATEPAATEELKSAAD